MGESAYAVRKSADRERIEAEAELLETIRSACSHAPTRKVLRLILRECGVHQSPYAASAAVYRNCGRLEVGLHIRNLLKRALVPAQRDLFDAIDDV